MDIFFSKKLLRLTLFYYIVYIVWNMRYQESYPSVFNMTRQVERRITIIKNIRTYNTSVFFLNTLVLFQYYFVPTFTINSFLQFTFINTLHIYLSFTITSTRLFSNCIVDVKFSIRLLKDFFMWIVPLNIWLVNFILYMKEQTWAMNYLF